MARETYTNAVSPA